MTLRLVTALASSLPDYGDDEATAAHPDQERPAPARRASFVRLKSVEEEPVDAERADVERFRAMVRADHVRLTELLAPLASERPVVPLDPSARAAAQVIGRRIGDVGYVRDALATVEERVSPEIAPLFTPDAPLAPFLKGVAIWCDGVVEALAILEEELTRLVPRWASLRGRLRDATQFHFAGLTPQIREHLGILDAAGYGGPELEAMRTALDELFFAAAQLEAGLGQPFG